MNDLTEQEVQLLAGFWKNEPQRKAVTKYIQGFLGGNHLGQFIARLPGTMSDAQFAKNVKIHIAAQRQLRDAILNIQDFAKEKTEATKQHR